MSSEELLNLVLERLNSIDTGLENLENRIDRLEVKFTEFEKG